MTDHRFIAATHRAIARAHIHMGKGRLPYSEPGPHARAISLEMARMRRRKANYHARLARAAELREGIESAKEIGRRRCVNSDPRPRPTPSISRRWP